MPRTYRGYGRCCCKDTGSLSEVIPMPTVKLYSMGAELTMSGEGRLRPLDTFNPWPVGWTAVLGIDQVNNGGVFTPTTPSIAGWTLRHDTVFNDLLYEDSRHRLTIWTRVLDGTEGGYVSAFWENTPGVSGGAVAFNAAGSSFTQAASAAYPDPNPVVPPTLSLAFAAYIICFVFGYNASPPSFDHPGFTRSDELGNDPGYRSYALWGSGIPSQAQMPELSYSSADAVATAATVALLQ